jgi:WD40 repeat protein/serine/threonine protein kinase
LQAVLRDDNTVVNDDSTTTGDASTVPARPAALKVPNIPRYRIIQLIGTGGMGEVYKAEQRIPVQRIVAIKIIKLGMDSQEVLARFETEQQALAMLNHPNVASVFDAGITDTGRPYFVMEFVSGEPITRFCDRHNFNTRQRLELFVQACEAIQHAHQKAIIHRDLKPSNLLVTLEGGKPLLKVIDFGVAKATTNRLTERTMFTEVGQLIGTPEYMSPEQAEMSTLDVDTRTDIYSLGVVLYELLSGLLPFESATLRQGGYAEVQRYIREVDAPRPSTKLSTLGERASEIAKHHQLELRGLRKELKRELEWIPLMAMRKDRSRRYGTATEMSDDIHAYLDHRPLLAGPESARYRFRKLMRRHRVGTAFALLLIVGVVVTGLLAVRNRELYTRERSASEQAISQRARAEKGERVARQQLYAGNINLAQQAWGNADLERAVQLLESLRPRQGEEDQRGFEWWRLWKLTLDGESIEAPQDRSLASTPAIVSADGKLIATAWGSHLRIWSMEMKKWSEVARLPDEHDVIRCLAVAPNGQTICAAGSTVGGMGIALLWDRQTRASRMMSDFDAPVLAVAFNPDGSMLATNSGGDGNERNRIALWSIAALQKQRTFLEAIAPVNSLAYSPDGNSLAGAGGIEGKVICWETASGSIKRSPQLASFVSAIAFSPSGDQLSVACGATPDAGFIRNLDPRTLAPDPTMNFTGHVEGINFLAYSIDGKQLVSASCDRTARAWDAATGASLAVLRGHRRDVVSACFAGNMLVTRGADDTIRLWNPAQQEELILPHLRWQVEFSTTGLLASVMGNQIQVFNREGGEIASLDMKGYQSETAIAFSQDGKFLAAGNGDGFVRVWRTGDWSVLVDLSRAVRKLRFLPGKATLALVGTDGSLSLWELFTQRETALPDNSVSVNDVAFSANGATMAVITEDHVLTGSDVAVLMPIANLPGGDCIALSPDGKWLVTSRGRDLFCRDLITGELETNWAQGRSIAAVAFSADGKRLLTASSGGDGCVQLWSLDPLSVVASYSSNGSSFVSVSMSGDQQRLAAIRSHNGSSEAVIWEAKSQKAETVTSK